MNLISVVGIAGAFGVGVLVAQNNTYPFPSSGPVGIGTTSPAANLQVAKTSGFAQLKVGDDSASSSTGLNGFNLTNYSDGNNYFDSKTQSGGYTYFRTGQGSETGYTRYWMTLQASTGNVGIGPITSPAYRLDVANPTLGTVSGNTVQWGRFYGAAGGNTDQLAIFHNRYTAGSTWNSAEIKIQKIVDATPMHYLSFRGGSTASQLQLGYGTTPQLTLDNSGNVGIGTTNPQSMLAVNGTITTKEVIVTTTGWSDYVFQPDYRLRPLSEVASFIKENHHLPEIPSEKEVQQNGVSVGEMQANLLAKIEELTLHMIDADQRISHLERENRELQTRNRALLKNGDQQSAQNLRREANAK